MNTKIEIDSLKQMLDESQAILKEYQLKLKIFIKEKEVPERTITAILDDIFEYLIQTIELLRLMMLRDKPFFKQSAILVRSIFEYSVRAAWASRINKGWLKYQTYSAFEEIKTAKAAQQDEALKKSAEFKEKNLQEIIAKSGIDKKSSMPAKIHEVLEEIWQNDYEKNNKKVIPKNYTKFFYTAIYRFLSPYVHGNTLIFQTPDKILLRHIGGVTAQATFYICSAFLHSTQEDPNTEIDILEKKIVRIFTKNQNE